MRLRCCSFLIILRNLQDRVDGGRSAPNHTAGSIDDLVIHDMIKSGRQFVIRISPCAHYDVFSDFRLLCSIQTGNSELCLTLTLLSATTADILCILEFDCSVSTNVIIKD